MTGAAGRRENMTTTLRLAAVQETYVLMDSEATIERVAQLTANAVAPGGRLVVFPEVFVPGTPIWIESKQLLRCSESSPAARRPQLFYDSVAVTTQLAPS